MNFNEPRSATGFGNVWSPLVSLAGAAAVLIVASIPIVPKPLSQLSGRNACVAVFGPGSQSTGRFVTASHEDLADIFLQELLAPGNFVMAYSMHDPVEEKGSRSDYSIRNSNDELNVRDLVSRVAHQVRLRNAVATSVMKSLLVSRLELDPAACFSPRQLVVFYDPYGSPVGVVELCFTCRRYTLARPGVRTLFFGRGDLLAVATTLKEAGLAIGQEVPDLATYAAGLQRSRDNWLKWTDEAAAEDEASHQHWR
ncbi:hypothetical protein [Verrucomicrobium sp. BvORR106]|uniref:hypothetical protein n=1 Tax=Verrucomicrobium sp. BvORR106 TaxID=1403819 RepID=UPI00056F39E9|nr:hypothetical protein [Verrucomicrobium sp. BvORR106]